MFGEIFYWILNMSISAAIVGTVVFFIGKIKQLPRRIASLLFIIPYIRMTVPFGVGGSFSLMTLISKYTTKTIVIWEKATDFSMTNYIMAANSYFPITYKVNILENVFAVASVIWIIIALALLIAFISIYFLTLSELSDAVLLYDNIYTSEKITSPAVYGVFRPHIILPTNYNANELPYILAHEKKHIKRGDNLRRVVTFTVTAFHWFNPLVWLFLREYLTQTELACDEGVLMELDTEERKKYALTLLNAASKNEMFASSFGGAKVRVRVERILSYKKLSVFAFCAFAIFAVTVVCVLLTNAV